MAPPDVNLLNSFIKSTEIPAGSPTSTHAPASAPAPKPIDPPTMSTQIPTESPTTPTEIPPSSPSDEQVSTPKSTTKSVPKFPPPDNADSGLPSYQPYGTNPGFTGRRVPPIKFAHYNGSQYSTRDTSWKP